MIQDIGEGRFHNEYTPVDPQPDSRVLCYRGREILVGGSQEQISFLTYGEVTARFPELKGKETYLFRIDETTYYLFRETIGEDKISDADWDFPGFEWKKIEYLRTAAPRESAFAGVTGMQLAHWYQNRSFCPRCGKPMQHDDKERMMRCGSCGLTEYPKICPGVIVGVIHNERLLLTKYADRDFKRYALIAGFTEIGESIEETVKREVMEEVGLKVKNLRYYKSQPWSFSDTLLMGFFAEVDGEDKITLDETELSEGRWCTREEIPGDDGLSLTREMMRVFKEGKI